MSRPLAETPIVPIVYQRGPNRYSSGWSKIGPESTENQEAMSGLLESFAQLVAMPSPDDLHRYIRHSIDMFDRNPRRNLDYTQPQDFFLSPLLFAVVYNAPDGNLSAVLPAIKVGDPIEFFKYLRSEKFPKNRDKIIFAREHNTELYINIPTYLINEDIAYHPLITDSYSDHTATPEIGNEFQVTPNTQTYAVAPSQGRQQESLIMQLRSGARLRFGPFSRHLLNETPTAPSSAY